MTIRATICCWLALASPTVAADLTLQSRDGRVTLDARDVSVREILAEWARVGETRIVNADRVEGHPVTLQFVDVAERDALDIVLRSVSGYVALGRSAEALGASAFDRIYVLPTSVAPAVPPVVPVVASAPASEPPDFAPEAVPVPRDMASTPRQSPASARPTAPAGTVSGRPAAIGVRNPSSVGPGQGVRNFARQPISAIDAEERPNPQPTVPSLVPGVIGGNAEQKPGAASPGLQPQPVKK
jgi:hypothetical protein